MSITADATLSPPAVNFRAAGYYLAGVAALYIAILVWAVFNKLLLFYVGLGVPVAIYIVCSPRLALFQYVFVLFIEMALIPSIPIYLNDVSALLLVAAATVDFFVHPNQDTRLPSLVLNLILILAAIAVCGVFGYWPELLFRRVATFSLLIIVFLSVFRLAPQVGVEKLVRWFFWLAVANSLVAVIPFILAGGAIRSFALTTVFFDDIAMVAVPVGLALYLTNQHGRTWVLLLGTAICLGGVIATQSRAPLAMTLVASAFVLWIGYRKGKGADSRSDRSSVFMLMRRRGRYVIGSGVAAVLLALLLVPEYFGALFERFHLLASFDPSDSTNLRLALYERALTAFLDHPLFGVGPGGFYKLASLYNTMHMNPVHPQLKVLGAHNLVLHFMADLGLVGTTALIALVWNQYRLARRRWVTAVTNNLPCSLALLAWAFLFALSTLIEAGWMWGQLSFLAVFFSALVARQHDSGSSLTGRQPKPVSFRSTD